MYIHIFYFNIEKIECIQHTPIIWIKYSKSYLFVQFLNKAKYRIALVEIFNWISICFIHVLDLSFAEFHLRWSRAIKGHQRKRWPEGPIGQVWETHGRGRIILKFSSFSVTSILFLESLWKFFPVFSLCFLIEIFFSVVSILFLENILNFFLHVLASVLFYRFKPMSRFWLQRETSLTLCMRRLVTLKCIF